MFESDEATVPQDDETVISRERFTGLSEEMMQELRKTHELTRRMTPRLLIDVTSMIKPHLSMANTVKAQLAATGVLETSRLTDMFKTQLAAAGVLESSRLTGMLKEQLAATGVLKTQMAATSVLKEQMAATGILKTQMAVTGVLKQQLAAIGVLETTLLTDMLKTQLAVTGALETSRLTDVLKTQMAATGILKTQLAAMDVVKTSLSGSLIGISQTLDWVGGLTSHIGKIYEASVSTLIPHIEGIASTFVHNIVEKSGIMKGMPNFGKTEAVILYMLNVAGDIPNLDASVSGFKGWIMVKSILQYVQNTLCRFIQFEQHFEDVRKLPRIHRHGALHGIQLAHTTAMNSLRLFLLLDSIHYILESYKNNGKVIWI